MEWSSEDGIKKLFRSTDIYQKAARNTQFNRQHPMRLPALKRMINAEIQHRCLTRFDYNVALPVSDGSHRLTATIIASEGYEITDESFVLPHGDDDVKPNDVPFHSKNLHLPTKSRVYETILTRIALPKSLDECGILPMLRTFSLDCAITNDMSRGHTAEDAIQHTLRRILAAYRAPAGSQDYLEEMTRKAYLQGYVRVPPRSPQQLRSTDRFDRNKSIIVKWVFDDLVRSQEKEVLFKHLYKMKDNTMKDKMERYREAVQLVRGKGQICTLSNG